MKDSAPWVNPKGTVGNFSSGKLTTITNPHNVLNPTWFQSPYIYDGPNEWRGTSCNQLAANSIFTQYNGGKKKYNIYNKHMNKVKHSRKYKHSKRHTKKHNRGGTKGSLTAIPQTLLPGNVVNNTLINQPTMDNTPTNSWWSYGTPAQWGGYTWRNSDTEGEEGGQVLSNHVIKSKKSKKRKKKKTKRRRKKRKSKKGGNGYTMKTSVVNPKLSALANPIPIKTNNICPP